MCARPCTVAKLTVPPANHGRCSRASASCVAEQAADTGRIAEHLVEGDRDEVRLQRPADRAGWSARRPPRRAARPSPVVCASATRSSGCWTPEKFDCAGNAKRFGFDRSAASSSWTKPSPIERRSGMVERRVVDVRAFRARELANAVHRVVVVEREQKPSARRERVAFADVLQRGRGVQRENGRIVDRRR